MQSEKNEICPGCGGVFPSLVGPTHRYMTSSASCWDRYGKILAREYSEPTLFTTHRLSVDTYAVQHPGDGSRQAIQSVGLHLARLMVQLENQFLPHEANEVMLRMGVHKTALPLLVPPESYEMTVADLPVDGNTEGHIIAVRVWAQCTWKAWTTHHNFISQWVKTTLGK